MRLATRLSVMILGLALIATVAPAYYHYIHYTSRFSPYAPVPEKFDLNALLNRTLQVYVSDQAPDQLAPGDTFAAVLSQIRLAAATWNSVGTSNLRVSFAGVFTAGTPHTTPGVEITFEELPPGFVAVAGPTNWADMVTSPNSSFVPITRSVVILGNDLSQRPSFKENFFLTVLHEMGHALGLQHTLTSATMSTDYTRATTKARPLTNDDIAAISLLYPTTGFAASMGAITGRVTMNGGGVHMASVVALPPNGMPLSALTNPDGTYRIDGLPRGSYFVYVHTLPPTELQPHGITLPRDPDGKEVPASGAFVSQFYPGTISLQQARAVSVVAGTPVDGIDFSVQPRADVPLYGITTYSYPGGYAVKPAYLSTSGSRMFLAASGTGLVSNGALAPGLNVAVVGGSLTIPQGWLRAYATYYAAIDFQLGAFPGEGPRHLLFSLPGDFYVLPAGVNLAQKQPPSITSVTPFMDGATRSARLSGTYLSANTQILFDGVPAPISRVDGSTGDLIVAVPPGPGGYRAVVVALNDDGQSSLLLQADAPPAYTYDVVDAPFITISPAVLPAGAEAMIEIDGVNTSFVDGLTSIGFGTSDIAVRRLWVINSKDGGPSRILANVTVAPNAAVGSVYLTVMTGLQMISQPFAFQIQTANPNALVLNPQVVNATTGLASICTGCPAVLSVQNLTALQLLTGVTITVGDRPATILSAGPGQVTFQVPQSLPLGPAILRLQVGASAALPILVSIDPAPPQIMSVQDTGGVNIDSNHPAQSGNVLNIFVAGLADPGTDVGVSRVAVTVGGVLHSPTQVTAQQNGHVVQIVLASNVPVSPQVSLQVSVDGRFSGPYFIPVRGQ